jgi:hypothetical protein
MMKLPPGQGTQCGPEPEAVDRPEEERERAWSVGTAAGPAEDHGGAGVWGARGDAVEQAADAHRHEGRQEDPFRRVACGVRRARALVTRSLSVSILFSKYPMGDGKIWGNWVTSALSSPVQVRNQRK